MKEIKAASKFTRSQSSNGATGAGLTKAVSSTVATEQGAIGASLVRLGRQSAMGYLIRKD
jgi:hypothetical protein